MTFVLGFCIVVGILSSLIFAYHMLSEGYDEESDGTAISRIKSTSLEMYRCGDAPLFTFVTILFGCVGSAIGFIIMLATMSFMPVTIHETAYITPIASLEIGNTVNGSFILGSGSFNGKEQYCSFVVNTDKSYSRYYMPISSRIYEGDYVPFYSYVLVTKSLPEWFATSFNTSYKKDHKIYVPNDTIVKDFNL